MQRTKRGCPVKAVHALERAFGAYDKGEDVKEFTTTGPCIPGRHYMADPSDTVNAIRKLVDAGKYFTMARPRQYGKTTTLNILKEKLKGQYMVLALDFQALDRDAFQNGASFSQAFARLIPDLHEFGGAAVPDSVISALGRLNDADPARVRMDDLFRILKRWIRELERPLVLMVDKVNSASDHQAFMDFLAQLRSGYISRETDGIPAFRSVILAGVTDIRPLKGRIRREEEHSADSPWNIAADFDIDMSLSESGIRGMLDEYAADHHLEMDTKGIAGQIRAYTSGYPYLVSRICQLIDRKPVPGTLKTPGDACAADVKLPAEQRIFRRQDPVR